MLHIVPIDDVQPHRLDTTCDCEPDVEFMAQVLVTHMAFDGRQEREPEVTHPEGWGVFWGDDGELIR
jgi:hypothetical protein